MYEVLWMKVVVFMAMWIIRGDVWFHNHYSYYSAWRAEICGSAFTYLVTIFFLMMKDYSVTVAVYKRLLRSSKNENRLEETVPGYAFRHETISLPDDFKKKMNNQVTFLRHLESPWLYLHFFYTIENEKCQMLTREFQGVMRKPHTALRPKTPRDTPGDRWEFDQMVLLMMLTVAALGDKTGRDWGVESWTRMRWVEGGAEEQEERGAGDALATEEAQRFQGGC